MNSDACSNDTFLGFPTWYKYLDLDAECNIVNFDLLSGDAWLVGAAILEILLRIAALVAFFMVIYGGIRIITSTGSPDSVAQGRKAVANAIVGFAVAISATTVVSYLARELGATGAVGSGDPDTALEFITGFVFRLAAGLTVLFVALSAFHFTTAGGDSSKVARARSSLIAALIGFMITLFAAGIVAFVGGRL